MRSIIELTDEQLHTYAPSIMTQDPSPRMSTRYKQVKTIDLVNLMRKQDWVPTRARQINIRLENNRPFCKHEIRFSRRADVGTQTAVGGEMVQAILTNSHNGTSVFKFLMGIYRLVCSNGLVVAQSKMGAINIKHVGFDPQEVIDAASTITDRAEVVASRINAFKSVELFIDEQFAFARAASKLIGDEETPVVLDSLLRAKRYEDHNGSLWTTYNVVQENMLKGGVRLIRPLKEGSSISRYRSTRTGDAISESGLSGKLDPNKLYRVSKSKAVKSIDKDIKLNEALWTLTEEFAALKNVA